MTCVTISVFSVNTLGIVTVIFLKLVSYACVNNWCRSHRKNRVLSRRKTISISDESEYSVLMLSYVVQPQLPFV